MTTKEWLDKIFWDKNENEEDYRFAYLNLNKEVIVPYNAIITRDQFSFTINQNGSIAEIPYHRIRKIFKKEIIVFSRRC